MTRTIPLLVFAAAITHGAAFVVAPQRFYGMNRLMSSVETDEATATMKVESSTNKVEALEVNSQTEKVQTKPKASKKPAGDHKEGLLSPFVILMKRVLGEDELNQLRGKIIGLHSDVIGKFVDTYDSPVGEQVLRALFELADKNKNGTIEEDELAASLRTLGFDLKEKQIKGIFERADLDANGGLDYEEWRKEAPKTLRTNLIKLAKRNGGEMGLLA